MNVMRAILVLFGRMLVAPDPATDGRCRCAREFIHVYPSLDAALPPSYLIEGRERVEIGA